MANLVVMPTGFTIPDSANLSSVEFSETSNVMAIFKMHNVDFLKNLESFYKNNNIKRYVDMERLLRALEQDATRPPFQRYLKLFSTFQSCMESIAPSDWFIAQFNSSYLSKMDKEFLMDYLRYAFVYRATTGSKETYQMATELARLNVTLSVTGNRVKSAIQPVDTNYNDSCVRRFKDDFEQHRLPRTWSDFMIRPMDTYGDDGFKLLLVFLKAIFLTGYTDAEYTGG